MTDTKGERRAYTDGWHAALVSLKDGALWRGESYPAAWDAAMSHWRDKLLPWAAGDVGGDPVPATAQSGDVSDGG